MTNDIDDRPLVMITGSSGLIGTRVMAALEDAYRIVALDVREPDEGFSKSVTFFECDLTSDESTSDALYNVRSRFGQNLASVVHLAAYYDFSGEPSPLYEELTVKGTQRLLRGLRLGFEVEQFVFASTLLVMKPAAAGQRLDEISELAADWDYPASKIRAEAVIEEERGMIPAVILRLAGVYDERGHSPPIAQQIWRIREHKLEGHLFPGNAARGQSFVHLEDAAICFRRVVDARKAIGNEVFLIGEPETYSYAVLQERIGELLHGRRWRTLRIPATIAKAGAWIKDHIGRKEFIKPWMIDLADAHYPISIDHAREVLGWEPRHRLIDSLSAMIEELERDPVAWYMENHLPLERPADERHYRGRDTRV